MTAEGLGTIAPLNGQGPFKRPLLLTGKATSHDFLFYFFFATLCLGAWEFPHNNNPVY